MAKENGLIGKTDIEITEIIGISPLYEMRYEEYFNGEKKTLEGPDKLWKYTLYDRDDSGVHLLFKWSEEKGYNVVESAYISTINSENYLELYEIIN